MFKQISQIGKNLSEELQKGLSDELLDQDSSTIVRENSPQAQNPENASDGLQLKLKKLAKYEAKYPLLLQAYRQEKQRLEKCNARWSALERVLVEYTPIGTLGSLLSENSDKNVETETPLDSLVTFFQGTNTKMDMLNAEIKRLSALNKEQQSELRDTKAKLKIVETEQNPESPVKTNEELRTESSISDDGSDSHASTRIHQQLSLVKEKDHLNRVDKVSADETQNVRPSDTPEVDKSSLSINPEKSDVALELPESAKEDLIHLKKQLKAKEHELEEVRDMLREVGNELVETKNYIKELKEKKSVDKNTLERLNELQNQLKSIKKEHGITKDELNAKSKELDGANRHVAQKDKTINYMEKQVKDMTAREQQLLANLKTAKSEKAMINDKLIAAQIDVKKLTKQLSDKEADLMEHLRENGKLTERMNILQEKLNSFSDMKSNSNDIVSSFKRQIEEQNLKLRESSKRIMSMEGELNDYVAIVRERNKELDTMKRLLSEKDFHKDNDMTSYRDKIKTLTESNQGLELKASMLESKMLKESNHWKQINNQMQLKIDDLTIEKNSLVAKLGELEGMIKFNEKDGQQRSQSGTEDEDTKQLHLMIKELKKNLLRADQRIKDLQMNNDSLASSNNDLTSKLDRMTKNFKSMSNKLNLALKKNYETPSVNSNNLGITSNSSNGGTPWPSRSNSIASELNSMSEKESENDGIEKIAYIKNVLLGFMEHRDQRSQLLPVVSMLLHLDNAEERKFLMALK